jgi:hypothetical protein
MADLDGIRNLLVSLFNDTVWFRYKVVKLSLNLERVIFDGTFRSYARICHGQHFARCGFVADLEKNEAESLSR